MKPLTLHEHADVLSATAEQMRVADALGRMENSHLVQPDHHPWVVGLGERVIAALTGPRGSRMCRHLGRRGPEAMFGEFIRAGVPLGQPPVLLLYCRDCLVTVRSSLRLGPIDDTTCDRCDVFARGLALGALPIGPLLLSFGVCRSCATELGMVKREEAPA